MNISYDIFLLKAPRTLSQIYCLSFSFSLVQAHSFTSYTTFVFKFYFDLNVTSVFQSLYDLLMSALLFVIRCLKEGRRMKLGQS